MSLLFLLGAIKSSNCWYINLVLCYHVKTLETSECLLYVLFALLPTIETSLVEVGINYGVVDKCRKVDTVQAISVTTRRLKVSACPFEDKTNLSII